MLHVANNSYFKKGKKDPRKIRMDISVVGHNVQVFPSPSLEPDRNKNQERKRDHFLLRVLTFKGRLSRPLNRVKIAESVSATSSRGPEGLCPGLALPGLWFFPNVRLQAYLKLWAVSAFG